MFKKIIFTFFVFTFIVSSVYSQSSYLQLSLFDDGDFSVTFDNITLGAGNYAEFDNVTAGEHSLKVMREGIKVPPQGEVIFEGKIKIPSGSDIYAVIDEYNTFVIYKRKPYAYNRLIPIGEFVRRCGDDGVKREDREIYSSNDECKYKVMKKDDFSELKSSINNRTFESSNSAIVKSAIDNNYFTSEQIRELMRFFTFEDTKLEIAKYSYKKVCDTKNFFKVYDAFDFESSITELKNYISGK